MITITLTEQPDSTYVVDDDGGLCGDPETLTTHPMAQAAAEQRMRVYAVRGHAVLPWEVQS